MADLFLVRGISGAGKSTLAHKLSCEVVSADDFFMVDGQYKFNATALPQAHQWCQSRAEFFLTAGNDVVVANTFCERWEMEPYIAMAKKFKATLTVVNLYDGGLTDSELAARNEHGVNLDGISKMRQRYEHDWKKGNPIAPWLRKEEKPKPVEAPKPKAETKPEVKVEAKPEPKPEPKPSLKAEVKSEPKPEPKPSVKSESSEKPKPEVKAQPAPAPTPAPAPAPTVTPTPAPEKPKQEKAKVEVAPEKVEEKKVEDKPAEVAQPTATPEVAKSAEVAPPSENAT